MVGCTQPAVHDADVCRDHFLDEGEGDESELVDALLGHPAAQHVLGRIDSIFDRLEDWVVNKATGQMPPPGPPPPPRGERRAPPPPPPPPREDPRLILGFAPGQRITQADVKRRRRELAQLFHPDRGGNEEAMRRVSMAADALLAELG